MMKIHWIPISLVLCISSALVLLCSAQIHLQLTTDNILSIRPGMSEEQVRHLLGEPIRKTSNTSNVSCKCNFERICKDVVTHTFEYTKSSLVHPYPMAWVHFNENHEVKEVYVKKYVIGNKWPIYRVNREICDTIDEYLPKIERDRMDSLQQFFK